MDDKRRMNTTDEDVDLSGMINEYSQDNELRKKIEELKKQKEEEKRMYASRQQETSQGSIFDNISDTGSFKRTDTQKQGGIPDIRVDDTQLDKTRVGFDDAPAYDKTLVIMNPQQIRRRFSVRIKLRFFMQRMCRNMMTVMRKWMKLRKISMKRMMTIICLHG